MTQSITRRSLYDALIGIVMIVAVLCAYTVWNAETKRVIHNNHNVLSYKILESLDPVRFAKLKADAWEMLSMFSAVSALFLIFRKEAHAFLAD